MKNKRGLWVSCGLLLVVLGAAQTVHGKPAVLDCSADPACLSLFERAKEQSARGNLPEALRLYKLAFEVRADPRLLFSIARVLHKLDRKQEAVPYYQQFLSSPIDDPEQKAKVRGYLAEINVTSAQPSPVQATPTAPAPTPSTDPLVEAKPQPVDKPTPVYKRWWFWTIIGGVAAAGIAGGIAGGLANRQSPYPEPSFRPFQNP